MPEQAVGQLAFGFPGVVIGDEIGEKFYEEFFVPVDEVSIPSSRGEPTAEFVEVRLWFAFVAAQPEFRVIVQVAVVAQPAAFGEVESGSATDGVKLASVVDGWEKLCDDVAVERLLDVLAKAPPAEIVNLFDVAVGALEEWDVLLQPGPGIGVGDVIHDGLWFHRVEMFDVVGEGGGFEDGKWFAGAAGQTRTKEQEETERIND